MLTEKDRMNQFVQQFDDININDELIILDIGSRDIRESIMFAEKFPNARVYAFEPNPATINLCNDALNNTLNNIRDRITLIEKAACEIDGTIKFYPLDHEACESRNEGVASLFKFLDGAACIMGSEVWIQKEIEVKSCRIDTWCKENNINHIDLIWMDVQGAELLVLKGMPKMLKTVRGVATETGLKPYYDGHTLKPEITAYLKQFGLIEQYSKIGPGHDYECDVVYIKGKT